MASDASCWFVRWSLHWRKHYFSLETCECDNPFFLLWYWRQCVKFKSGPVYQVLQEFSKFCKSLPSFARVFQVLQESSKFCKSFPSFARVFQVLLAQLWPNPFLLDRGWVANRRRLVWKTRRWFAGVRSYQRNLPSLLDLSWSNIWRFAVYDGIFF